MSARHGPRSVRVTASGQRAIGAPVTVDVRLDLYAIRAVLDAAGDMLALMTTPRSGTNEYAEPLRLAIAAVRPIVELAAADAGADEDHRG